VSSPSALAHYRGDVLTPTRLPEHQLVVMEEFLTLQGEGAHTGTAAYFIRLAGCDVGCVWCDVKESWDAARHPTVLLTDVVARAQASGAPIAVVTGGEPTLHRLTALTAALRAAGLRTHLETSGTQPLTGEWDWITFSPKKFKAPRDEYYAAAHELKVIVAHPSDLAWAEGHAARLGAHCLTWLQPEWDTPQAPAWIIDYIRAHPRWRLSLQTHKYLNIP